MVVTSLGFLHNPPEGVNSRQSPPEGTLTGSNWIQTQNTLLATLINTYIVLGAVQASQGIVNQS